MSRIHITKVQTMSQSLKPTESFRWDDALALEAFVCASPELADLSEAMFQIGFQILDTTTNRVVFHKPVLSPFLDGQTFWVLLGDNLQLQGGSYTTPGRFGLLTNWDAPFSGRGVFGFRAIIQAYQINNELLDQLDDFDVSDTVWFQVRGQSFAVADLINTKDQIWPGSTRSLKDDGYPGDMKFSHGKLSPQET